MATDLQKANLEKARAARAAKRTQEAFAAVQEAQRVEAEKMAAKTFNAAGEQVAGVHAPTHEATHTPTHTPTHGRVEAMGRGGEILSRKRTHGGDIFDVPKELIPKGWEYQWCAVTIVGNSEILMDQNLMMAENGWRPVPATRYPGRYMPAGHTGSITRGGQMLMERPAVLCDEARKEDVKLARQLISDRNESLKLSGMKKNMAEGFEMGGKYRGTGGDIRMSIDRALDAPVPSHTLEPE